MTRRAPGCGARIALAMLAGFGLASGALAADASSEHALAAAGSVPGDAAAAPEPASGPPNVLLLTIDTLRADHLSSYGYARETSPHLDALASQGVRFAQAIVQRGGTWPSLTSILTSLHPRAHGVRSNGDMLDEQIPILAQILRPHGYRTAAFLANMISAPNRGFDHKEGYAAGDRDARATRDAVAWLREHDPDQRFFLWLHLLGPHDPYTPNPEYRRRFATAYEGPIDGSRPTLQGIFERKLRLKPGELGHIVALYDAEIAETDDRVGRVLAALDEIGARDDTLVVVTSDHGEELYQHNFYFFHTYSIYDSVLRVPLLLRLPGVLPAGRVVGSVVESVDVAPTVLDLAGIAAPAHFQGTSLRARAVGSAPEKAGVAFSELGPYVYSVRTDRWHYISNPQKLSSPRTRPNDTGQRGLFDLASEELYDVVADPRQRVNLVRLRPRIAARLRARLEAWLARDAAVPQYTPGRLSDETRAELEALGYLVE